MKTKYRVDHEDGFTIREGSYEEVREEAEWYCRGKFKIREAHNLDLVIYDLCRKLRDTHRKVLE